MIYNGRDLERIQTIYSNHNRSWIITDLEISNFGNVRGKIFNHKPFTKECVRIIKGRRCLGVGKLHRIVWELFNGPIPEKHVIHHKDHNKLNDRLDNLEMLTISDHMKHHRKDLKGFKGQKMSEEQKLQHSQWMKENKINVGKKHSEETKRKMSEHNAWKGKHLPLETRQKIADSLKRYKKINN